MVGELIMLPVRVGVRATQLWLRAAEGTVSAAASATTRLVGLASARSGAGQPRTAVEFETPHSRTPEPALPTQPTPSAPPRGQAGDRSAAHAPSAPPESARVAAPDRPPPPPEPEPVHVSEEPALVEELAEPGAEDGAGAEVRIDEPWEAYGRMSAKEIVSRLAGSTPAELAQVQLYESSHRRRQTILNAVERELRSANGRRS